MLDMNRIRKEPREVEKLLANKGCEVNFDELLAMDAKKRTLAQEGEALKAKRNQLSAQVPSMKKAGQDTSALFEEVRRIGDEIKALDDQANDIGKKITDFLAVLPNLPDPDLLPGGKENNRVLHQWGEKPTFDFAPKEPCGAGRKPTFN